MFITTYTKRLQVMTGLTQKEEFSRINSLHGMSSSCAL